MRACPHKLAKHHKKLVLKKRLVVAKMHSILDILGNGC